MYVKKCERAIENHSLIRYTLGNDFTYALGSVSIIFISLSPLLSITVFFSLLASQFIRFLIFEHSLILSCPSCYIVLFCLFPLVFHFSFRHFIELWRYFSFIPPSFFFSLILSSVILSVARELFSHTYVKQKIILCVCSPLCGSFNSSKREKLTEQKYITTTKTSKQHSSLSENDALYVSVCVSIFILSLPFPIHTFVHSFTPIYALFFLWRFVCHSSTDFQAFHFSLYANFLLRFHAKSD